MKKLLLFLAGISLMLLSCEKAPAGKDTPEDPDEKKDTTEVISYPTLKVGELTDDGLGVVYYVSPADSTTGLAISLRRAYGLAWSTDTQFQTFANSFVNGRSNTDLLMSTDSTKFPAALWCAKLGNGWYLPSRDEVDQLFDIYNGVPHTSPDFVAAVPERLTLAEQEARYQFDKMLLTNGADERMNEGESGENGNAYWSSTESLDNFAYYTRFGNYLTTATSAVKKDSPSRHVRCIRALGPYSWGEEPMALAVSTASVAFEMEGGTKTFTVRVLNGNLKSVSLSDGASGWLTLAQDGTTISLTAGTNTTSTMLQATITIVAEGASGESRTATVSVSQKSEPKLSLKPGDAYMDGFVASVADDESYVLIMSGDELTGGCWSTDITTVVGCSKSDAFGIDDTAKILKTSGYSETTYPAAAWCVSHGEGWHLPSRAELKALRKAIDADNTFTTLNAKLEASGATPVSATTSYWTSNEASEVNAYAIKFVNSKGAIDDSNWKKSGTARLVRAWKKIAL